MYAESPDQLAQSDYVCSACATIYRRQTEFCVRCFRSGIIVPRFIRPADEILPSQPGKTANELAAANTRSFQLKAYPELRLGPGSLLCIHGGPGQGKTTWSLKAAEAMRPALVCPLEEGFSPVLTERLQRLELRHADMHFEIPSSVTELVARCDKLNPRCLVIDSVQMSSLLPEDLLKLARSRKFVLIALSQHTKAGECAGSHQLQHLADVVVRVEAMKWHLEKSRYQAATLVGDVL